MQHIYLSEQPVLALTADQKAEAVFRYRGEASGPHDDPQGYKRMMSRSGHEVLVCGEVVGKATPATKGVVIATRTELVSAGAA